MNANSHVGAVTVPNTKLLTMGEFAEAIGVSERHVRRLIDKKKIRSIKLGRLRRIPPSEIHDLPQRLIDEA